MSDDWTQEENLATAQEYFAMLEQELVHQPYVKRQHNERVQALTGRSRGAVEFKFQNISAVMQQLHAPWVEGYKPARNFQASLADAVESVLSEKPQFLDLMRAHVENPAAPRTDHNWNVIEAPRDLKFADGTVRVLHTDFVMLEAANRTLGASGEKLVLARERELLKAHGRHDLADRVEHVSATKGDGLGYDITSFDPDGRPRLIEVKTTRRGPTWPMFVSRNEVSVSRREASHFVLSRVFDFAKPRVGLYELNGPIDETCVLEPETWRALPA